MIKNVKILHGGVSFKEKFEKLFESLNRSQKYYLISALFMVTAAFWYSISIPKHGQPMLILSVLLMAVGVISDLLFLYKALWDTILGKAALLLFYALCTTLAYAFASRFINELVQYETVSLTYTTNLIAIFSIPIIGFIALTFIFFVFVVFSIFYAMYLMVTSELKNNKFFSDIFPQVAEMFHGFTTVVRIFVFAIIFQMAHLADKNYINNYSSFLNKMASWFIYSVEAAHYSRCFVDADVRVIKVNDNEIVTVSFENDIYKFEPKKCRPLLLP